ncbi:MAG: DUF2723 domain-containing protein [Bacteroidales bacterium]|nr:DUF2723 domain-containing protein [Bacteroidales bacterium]
MKKYKLINNIAGWTIFAIAAVVYLMTIEPTTSFWDCGEFITSAYKLEVGHPPGAPFFMLTANAFTQLTSDPANVAILVNAMSALLSALTILFLFWTITHLTRKLVLKTDQRVLTLGQIIVVIGSGLVGALAYTFSDTFWFSAVEAEVYAYSSMFTALVFWLILKWEDNAHKPHSDKWIVLIAYMMGLSIGVHLLNLLCIPAIVLVYYYKKNDNINWKGTTLSLLFSFVLVAILMYGIIPGFTKVGGWFELLAVNTFGMSYNSGLIIYLIILVGTIVWSILESMSPSPNKARVRFTFLVALAMSGVLFIGDSIWLWIVLIGGATAFTFKSKKASIKLINLTMTCLLVILIGYSSFALIPIRSIANPPMDQNSPENVFSLGGYLNREQYGDRPLLYGRTFASEVERDATGAVEPASEKKRYSQIIKSSPDEKDRYEATTSYTYKYTNSMLFPRMHSHSGNPSYSNHLTGYKMWGGIKNEKQTPTMLDNIRFFFSYQLNYMYWRYFMWNFSGRQNDVQGDGGITNGNWITGISFIDEHLLGLGPQTDIAPDVADNKARNVYYMLPLLLGIIGIVYQLRLKEKGLQSFIVVFMLFFMTGIAIVLYLNQTPFEPRERDYAYAGSFYAFTIWIGMGVAGISGLIRKYLNSTAMAGGIATLLGILIPIQMAGQNWDDHDRSKRYSARDIGKNYLTSVAPNGIIFCNGDNDTFPLWYAQEVEGYRTDVRVCNLSYLQTEWYVDQMVRHSYESEPLPISWTRKQYSGDRGTHAYLITQEQIKGALKNSNIPPIQFASYFDAGAFKDTMPLTEAIENLRDGIKPPNNPFIDNGGVIPSDKLYLDIDSAKVDWDELNAQPSSRMTINLEGKSGLYRQELMILELLSNINKDNWDRPLYYATTVGHDTHLNMTPNFSLNGLTYRVTPGQPLEGGVNTEVMFDNMMNKFKWGGFDNPKVYLDENNRRMFSQMRNLFAMLVEALIDEGKNEKALQALEKSLIVLPSASMPFGHESIPLAESYLRLGEIDKGDAIIKEIKDRIYLNLDWYNRLSPQQITNNSSNILHYNLGVLLRITDLYKLYDYEKYTTQIDDLLSWSQFYYTLGIGQLPNTVLKQITDESIRGYYLATEDTVRQSMEEETMQKSIQLMQEYSPELLQHYNTQQQ